MPYRGRIRAAERQRFFDSFSEPIPAVPLAQPEQLDHRPRARLWAVPFPQALPQTVEAFRPALAFAPLLQRTRSCQCARLALQHVKIVLQIQHLLVAVGTTLVSRPALSLLPNFDIGRQQLHPRSSARLQRRGVAVRTRLHTTLAIDHRKANLGQLESLRRQRQQMLALDPHGLAHRVRFARDPTLLVGATSCEQKLVQLFQTLHPRNRHQMIAPEVAHFAFHSALLVSSRRIAELRLKAPVRAEGNEPLSLLPLIPAQNLLHRTLQVVVAQPPKHPAEELKRELVCFQKRLLVSPQNLVDELFHRFELGLRPQRNLALRRDRARHRLPYHPPMHVELHRHTSDRPHSKPVLPPNLLKQFHLASPVHRPPRPGWP